MRYAALDFAPRGGDTNTVKGLERLMERAIAARDSETFHAVCRKLDAMRRGATPGRSTGPGASAVNALLSQMDRAEIEEVLRSKPAPRTAPRQQFIDAWDELDHWFGDEFGPCD